MKPTDITRRTIWEDGDVTEMARLLLNGTAVTQAGISSIARKIFDLDGAAPTTAIDTSVPVVASVIFDALQTDARWDSDADSTGYNFRERIAAAEFPTQGNRYRVEYLFTGSNGEKFWLVFEHLAQTLYSS